MHFLFGWKSVREENLQNANQSNCNKVKRSLKSSKNRLTREQWKFKTSSRNEMKLTEEVKNETMNSSSYFVMEGSRKKRDVSERWKLSKNIVLWKLCKNEEKFVLWFIQDDVNDDDGDACRAMKMRDERWWYPTNEDDARRTTTMSCERWRWRWGDVNGRGN